MGKYLLNVQRKLSMRAKIILINLLIMVLLGCTILILSSRNTSLQEEIASVSEHDLQVHETVSLLEKQLLDMETGMRGFIITGKETYLEPYQAAVSSWEINYDLLLSLVTNPSQQRNLVNIHSNLIKWIDIAGQTMITAKRDSDQEQINQFFQNDGGRTQTDAIRKQFQSFLDTELQLNEDRITSLKYNNQTLLLILYSIWFAVMVISLLINWFNSSKIISSVRQVAKTINQIATSGEVLDKRIVIETRDEIKELGDATNKLLDTIEQQNNTKAEIAELARELQEQKDVDSLGSFFINRIAQIYNIPYAVIYMKMPNNRLVKSASFAGGNEDLGKAEFRLGEGLVGQCAQDNRLLLIRDIPDHYVDIHSGIGQAAPKLLLIAPVQFEREVVAVVEIGSFHEFTRPNLDKLDQMLTFLGVSILSVTRRKEIEYLYEESQTANEELHARSEELNAQSTTLHAVNDELQRSSNFKSEFLANMSHELRTPLNSMLILSQLLTENTESRLNENELNYITTIHNAGQDLLNLINDILDLSKVEAGKLEIEFGPLVIQELHQTMDNYFTGIADRKSIDYQVSVHPDVPLWFISDVFRVQQILKNLLSNVFKFTQRGAVTLSLTKEVAEDWTKSELVFSVKDTGKGIPISQHEMIFEAFTQAEGGTARKFGGTGLGLAISNQLARLLGGRITIESVVGQGSEFKLHLPLRNEGIDIENISKGNLQSSAAYSGLALFHSTPIQSISDLQKERRLEGLKVLLVDDDERNLLALSTALEQFKMDVVVASDGNEALRLLTLHSFDFILMDIMMPDMDGYETIQVIRGQLGLKLPIIAVTAKAMKEDEDKCMEAGASNYISKPIHLPNLITVMMSHIKP